MNVPITEVGIDSSTLIVELIEPRKRKQTTPVMSAERMSVNSVSWIASWMNTLLSKFTSSFTSAGRPFASSATRSFTACATATEFAPCCFLMPMPIPPAPVHQRDVPDVLQPVLHPRDIADANVGIVDRLAAALLDLDVAHRLGRRALAHRADVELAARVLEIARGLLHLLALQRRFHVEHRQLQRLEFRVVHPHAQVARLVAGQRDLADAGQDLELVHDAQLDELGQRVNVARRRRGGQQQDRLVLRVGLHQRRLVHAQRQLHAADLRLHLGQRGVDVPVDVELERDRRLPLLDLRGDIAHALRGKHLLLQAVDHLALHDLRRRARPGAVDRQHGKIDVRLLGNAQARKADCAENDQRGHQHPSEDRPPNRQVRQRGKSRPAPAPRDRQMGFGAVHRLDR